MRNAWRGMDETSVRHIDGNNSDPDLIQGRGSAQFTTQYEAPISDDAGLFIWILKCKSFLLSLIF